MMTRKAVSEGRLRSRAILATMAMSSTLAMAVPSYADDATDIMKRMSAYLANQKSFSFGFNSSIEIVTREGQKVQFDSSGDASIAHPNMFRAHRVGGYTDIELVDDGKTLTLLGKNINKYAQIDAPGSIDQTIEELRGKYNANLPAADLILSDPFGAMMEDVFDAKHIGLGVIDGVECEHLAFRTTDTDWQIWVRPGNMPVPCKLVITSKGVGQAPQYSIEFKDWKTDVAFAADAFSFKPPSGAEKVEFGKLPHLDEVPQGVTTGAKP
jgi:hypothetical protein